MAMEGPSEAKRRWRRRLRSQWRSVPSAKLLDWAQAAVGLLQVTPEWRRAQTLFCFIATADELPTRPLIEAAWRAGKLVGAPVIDDAANASMSAYVINDWQQLRPGHFGIMAPDRKRSRLLAWSEIDLIIVPGLAFDRSCMRLGRGGGYYDRLLARLALVDAANAATVGWTAAPFLFDVKLPREDHDRHVDMIVTDREVHRCKRR